MGNGPRGVSVCAAARLCAIVSAAAAGMVYSNATESSKTYIRKACTHHRLSSLGVAMMTGAQLSSKTS